MMMMMINDDDRLIKITDLYLKV